MRISKEVKTALLVLSGIALFIVGFNYLKRSDLFNISRTFYVIYESVEGLSPSASVTVNGKNVGIVQHIEFEDGNINKPRVKLLIEEDFSFSKNSTAELYDTGFIGGKSIAIVPAFDGAEPAKNGDYLKGIVKDGLTELVSQKIAPLQEKMETMLTGAGDLFKNLNEVLDDNTKANLRKSVEGASKSIKSINSLIAGLKKDMDTVLVNANTSMTKLSSASDSISGNLDKTVANLEVTLTNIDSLITSVNSGKGSIGKLLKDEALYNNLEGASKQLEQLLQDMKLNPKRYVHFSLFGKKAPEYDSEGNESKDK